MKLKNLIALYMASPQWTNLKPNSKRIYENAMVHLAEFMSMDVKDITRPMVIDYRDKMFAHRGICKMAVTVLSNVLSFAYDRGMVEYNHASRMKGMPKKVPWKRWSLDEVDHVLASAPTHLKWVIILALYTGQRRSDLARMRWDQYDGEFIHIVQQKTGKALSIPVHPELKKALKKMKEFNPNITIPGRREKPKKVVCPYILHNTNNQPWQLTYLSSSITRLMKSLGYQERKLHGLRKTTASKLAEIGCSAHEIASITGQSLVEVMAYTQEAEQKKLAKRAIKRWGNASSDDSRGDHHPT